MAQNNAEEQKTIDEAKTIIDRFTGGQLPLRLELSREKTDDGRDSYSTSMEGGTLVVKASNGVALCRGAYEFIRSHGAGIRSWQGQSFFPEVLPQTSAEKVVTSPFRDHYYLNVVTYGYTMPYWNKERWDEEIDWMALHGIDMPLALVAQEAVYRIVFKEMGFTDAQIDEWEVGPAHLPWKRMGNLSGNSFDGPLTRNWDDMQIELQKHILGRMRTLGMKPIFPAFGGFVPPAFKNKYPGDVELTGWGWVPSEYRNYRLSPSNKLFVEIGTRFVQTWDSIFGGGDRYLSDSFNEMAIPNNKTLLTQYGDSIYKSIHQANPNAKWVMQGWTLGYQRGDWDEGNFQALVKNVPDDRFMILDMASDYNKFVWWNSYDWDFYPKFYDKEWVWSVIPNMGGKTAMTGNLEYYANGRLDALSSSNRGNLTGYGFAPEGVENNEMVYELLCDGGWTDQRIDLNRWMTNYAKSRYGSEMAAVESYYEGLRNSVYNSFTDHPRFGWQTGGNLTGTGSINKNNAYREGVEQLFSQLPESPQGTLLMNDLIEAAVIYAGGKVEDICAKIKSYAENNRKDEARRLMLVVDTIMTDMDRALTAHTLYRLEKWEQQAQDCGTTNMEKRKYARNARRIVSVWYGKHTYDEPVCDYAARLWSGIIRDYYHPRLRAELERIVDGKSSNRVTLENNFVNKAPTLSTVEPVPTDLVGFLRGLVERAGNATTSNVVRQTVIKTSDDFENTWYAIRGGYDPLNEHALTQQGDEAALGIQPYVGSGQQMWRLISTTTDGTYVIENRYGQNIKASSSVAPSTTLGTASVHMKILLKDDGSKRWTITPVGMGDNGLHAAQAGNVTTWANWTEGSSWIFEELPEAIVPEAVSADYERYVKKLEALRNKPMGQVGQVKNSEALENAIAQVREWAADINHQSYNAFLKKYAKLYQSIIMTEADVTGVEETRQLQGKIEVVGNTITVDGKSQGFNVYDSAGRIVPNKSLTPRNTYVVETEKMSAKVHIK